MSKEPQHSLQELDNFVISYFTPQRTQSSSSGLAVTIYQSFLDELNRLCQDKTISLKILRGIENHIEEKMIVYSQEICKVNKKRGRPLKNKEGQEILAQWIKKQNKASFTKREINKQYKLIMKELGKPYKGLSTNCLLRILHNHNITDLSITTRKVGRLSRSLKSTVAHQSDVEVAHSDQKQQYLFDEVDKQVFEKRQLLFESSQSNQNSLEKFLDPENDQEFLKEFWSDNYFTKKEQISDDEKY